MNKRLEIIPRVFFVANVFHFVSNLANWHFSNRERCVKFWLEETGELTSTEKESLIIASYLFKKYTFGTPKFWGLLFLTEDDSRVWSKAVEFFGEEDSEKFKGLYKIFEPRFRKLWKVDEILIKKWIERFAQLKDKISPVNLISDLNILFEPKNKLVNTVEVILLISSPGWRGGNGNLKPGKVTLELSRFPLEQSRPVILMMWHEIVHNVWQNRNYQNMVDNFAERLEIKKIESPIKKFHLRTLINEAVTESLFPHGYLGQKHFGFPSQEYFDKELPIMRAGNDKMGYWRTYSGYGLMPLVEKYLQGGERIDEKFLKRVGELIEEL